MAQTPPPPTPYTHARAQECLTLKTHVCWLLTDLPGQGWAEGEAAVGACSGRGGGATSKYQQEVETEWDGSEEGEGEECEMVGGA